MARQAPETKPGSLAEPPSARRPRSPHRHGFSGSARPGDAGEVDHPAAGVDHRPVLGRDQPLPRGPAAAVGERPLDRLAEARRRNGIRVEEAEQLAGGDRGAAVAAGGKAEVRPGFDHDRVRGQLAHRVRGPVGGIVVDDDQLVAVVELRGERGQRLARRLAVVVRNDDE